MSVDFTVLLTVPTVPSGREGHKEMYVGFSVFSAQRHDLLWGAPLGDRVKKEEEEKKRKLKRCLCCALVTQNTKYSTKCEFPDCDRGI